MSRAALHFEVNAAGNLDVAAIYEGGFDPANPAHDIAQTIAANIGKFLDPLTEQVEVSVEAAEAIQAERGELVATVSAY